MSNLEKMLKQQEEMVKALAEGEAHLELGKSMLAALNSLIDLEKRKEKNGSEH